VATLSNLIDEVKANLQGYTLNQDRITYVANEPSVANPEGGINATDISIKVGSQDNLSKGIIEIDDELIYVDSFNKTSNTLNVIEAGFGRGFQGTQAASHAKFAPVILSPTFPRSSIKKAINDTIGSLFPKLWGTASTTFTFNGVVNTYTLPAEAEEVLSVSWQSVGSSQEWYPVKRWRPDPMANTGAFTSGHTITVYDGITPGRTVQVYYTKEPSVLVNNSDDFSAVTGLTESCRDIVVLGAAYRLLSYIDPGRINLASAESDTADTKLPSTAGTSASRYIFALYQQRLNEEAGKLQGKFPTKIRYNR
jgi:hypothetical protein